MATATRSTVINDPVGIHARPAAQFAQAAGASGCTVTIAKGDGAPVQADSRLSGMGRGVQLGDTVGMSVEGDCAGAVADELINTLLAV